MSNNYDNYIGYLNTNWSTMQPSAQTQMINFFLPKYGSAINPSGDGITFVWTALNSNDASVVSSFCRYAQITQ